MSTHDAELHDADVGPRILVDVLVFGVLDVLFLIGFVLFLRDVYEPRPAR